MTDKITEEVEFPHVFCNKDGAWIDSKQYPVKAEDVTFETVEEFKCTYQLY